MSGMMDTVLNLRLNDEVVAGLAAKSGERFAMTHHIDAPWTCLEM